MVHHRILVLVIALLGSIGAKAQEPPTTVDLCKLYRDPAAYNHKLVRITGTVGVAFENFSIAVPNCGDYAGIWLVFGGDVPTPTKSTVNDTSRPKGMTLRVEKIPISLLKDATFEEFYRLLTTRRTLNSDGSQCQSGCFSHEIEATLVGRFFAGNLKGRMRGYGHLGCCSLFAIQQVESVKGQITDSPKTLTFAAALRVSIRRRIAQIRARE